MNNETFLPGEVIEKTIPDLRATIEKMEFDTWYEFGPEHYHGFFQIGKQKTRHPYHMEVKQRSRRVFVKKVEDTAGKTS